MTATAPIETYEHLAAVLTDNERKFLDILIDLRNDPSGHFASSEDIFVYYSDLEGENIPHDIVEDIANTLREHLGRTGGPAFAFGWEASSDGVVVAYQVSLTIVGTGYALLRSEDIKHINAKRDGVLGAVDLMMSLHDDYTALVAQARTLSLI